MTLYRLSRRERRQAITALLMGLPLTAYLIDQLSEVGGGQAKLVGGTLLMMSLAVVGAQVWWSANLERRDGNENG